MSNIRMYMRFPKNTTEVSMSNSSINRFRSFFNSFFSVNVSSFVKLVFVFIYNMVMCRNGIMYSTFCS